MPLPPADESLPLAGIRVLDFTSTIAGPSALRHMADFGAQVIKVESQSHPDGSRSSTPHAGGKAGINRSGYYAAYNAGKISMALNMQLPRAGEVLRRLVAVSDVLVEAFVPGVVSRWGFSWENVAAWNPRIIMASHCLQGQTGPHAKHRGFGQIAGGMSGWYDLTGEEGGEPLGPYSAYTDFLSFPFLLTAILAALEVRDQTGRGQYIDQAQLESSLYFLTAPLLDLQLSGHMATRHGNREAYAAPSNSYRCAGEDRWIAINVSTDEEWNALCRGFGRDDAAEDARFATFAGRKQHETEIDSLIGAWTAGEEPFALAERLQAAGVSAGVVERAQDLFEDRQLAHRGFWHRVEHSEIGSHRLHGQSFKISGMNAGPVRSSPALGEHTLDICHEVLGMDDAEIAEYAALGVFE